MQENEPDFENHIDDIVKAVGDKLERNVIANELRRYVDEYGIDLSTAKESIVRKHYGNPNELSVIQINFVEISFNIFNLKIQFDLINFD